MNRVSTLFLRLVIVLIAIGTLAVCIFALPAMAADDAARHPDLAYQQYPFLAYGYTLGAAFLFALYQGFKLLNYVDANKAFSESSAQALRYIKYCAITVGALMAAGIAGVMILSFGKGEDITGVVMFGLIITLVAAVAATLVAVRQRHVEKAIEMKSENDLTV